MKLKTLNDLESTNRRYKGDYCRRIPVDKLRQEAIKDIKNLTKEFPNTTLNENLAIIEYIKWKNNITEEDLK